MDRRLELQALLETLVDNVYFQPPEDVQMTYPAIRYENDDAVTEFAGDKPYLHTRRYQITLITPDADDPAREKLAWLPKCLYDRHYTASQLHHYVFNIFY